MSNGLTFGSDYISRHFNEIQNPFWYDVYKAVIDLYSSSTPRSWDEFLSIPLWYNIDIKVGRITCFIKRWYDAGISFINDLVDPTGNFCLRYAVLNDDLVLMLNYSIIKKLRLCFI